MRRTALSFAVMAGGAIALISVFPTAAAAGYNSTAEELIRTLSDKLILLGATIALIFEVALVYALLRYRNSGEAQTAEYNPRFYVSYLFAVGLILLFVGFASFQTLAALNEQEADPPEDAIEVDVLAEQWAWTFQYQDEGVTSHGTLVVPENETIHLRLTSHDVIHSFHAPALGVKQDANPGRWTRITFIPTNTGEYRLFCAEYCGRGHSVMLGNIRVVSSSEYGRWLEEQGGNSTANQSNQSRQTYHESQEMELQRIPSK